jgi:hypothetical protein
VVLAGHLLGHEPGGDEATPAPGGRAPLSPPRIAGLEEQPPPLVGLGAIPPLLHLEAGAPGQPRADSASMDRSLLIVLHWAERPDSDIHPWLEAELRQSPRGFSPFGSMGG